MMRDHRAALAVLLLTLIVPERGKAQTEAMPAPVGTPPAAVDSAVDSAAVARFLAAARTGTAPYRERSAAIAAGYRRIGPDFPAMGEHWVNVGILMRARLAPEHPAFLSYATIDGQPTLLGVAYAQPLRPGESPPAFPGEPDAWHDHVGSIADEIARVHQHGDGTAQPRARVAMLHAWIWLDNPDGVFATDNWAIPFARVGLEPRVPTNEGAARALSLASGGASHLLDLMRSVARLQPEAASEIERAVRVATERSAAIAESARRRGGAVSDEDLEALESLWTKLWREIERAAGTDVVAPIAWLAGSAVQPPSFGLVSGDVRRCVCRP